MKMMILTVQLHLLRFSFDSKGYGVNNYTFYILDLVCSTLTKYVQGYKTFYITFVVVNPLKPLSEKSVFRLRKF